ncbi:MAG TPA: S58 family peptidase, partial [Actinomycetota bacterium]|nr:S58 family peptidase [Actinomycetota bacterium]
MTRYRDLGLTVGLLPPGPQNAITDVEGVRVGLTTLIDGDGPLRVGAGPI